jgi:hypothetical protein
MVMGPRGALLSPAQKEGNCRVSAVSAFRLGVGGGAFPALKRHVLGSSVLLLPWIGSKVS